MYGLHYIMGLFFQLSRSPSKMIVPFIAGRMENGHGRLLPQLIIFLDLANADFCTGNRADDKSAVPAITGVLM